MTEWRWQDLAWRQRPGRPWTPEARLFAAFLLSGPGANRIGCFAFDADEAARETGLPLPEIQRILAEFTDDGFARFDRALGWVWLPEVLARHPFLSTEEVRQTLPALAAAPRGASFHAELVQAFRASADRPGAPPTAPETKWLGGLFGDQRATILAGRLSIANERIRRQLPGLPRIDAKLIRGLARTLIACGDYGGRWRSYLTDLVDTPALRGVGLACFAAAILFVVFPGIDLGVAGWFFDPPRDFSLGASWVGRFFDGFVHYAMEWFLPVIVGVYAYGAIRRRPVWGFGTKRFLFVTLSIALSAGVLTNVVLKDSWGRARPSQVTEFGGPKQFSPPFMRSSQCAKNCSFVSGDASLAASFVSFAVIADRNRRRWWFGILSFATVVGVMRMARGSHFLSDVFFGVSFTVMIVLAMERVILADGWRRWPRWRQMTEPQDRSPDPA